MKYPIVKITTPDKLILFGLLAEADNSETILINIHGTGSGFYIEEFESFFVESLPDQGISTLFTNNRGNFVMEAWQKTGAAVEKFEDCLIDIDSWIEFAFSEGYKRIILQGHSFGTEKIVYYMEKGKYKNSVVGVILLGFSDSFGTQMRFLKSINVDLMAEAKKLISEGKGEQFLTSVWRSQAGEVPMNAYSYINFFSEDSELSKALPFRQGKDLTYFSHIKVPILGIISNKDLYTIIPIPNAVELMKKENSRAEIHTISDTNHSFEGKQKELVELISEFATRNNLTKK